MVMRDRFQVAVERETVLGTSASSGLSVQGMESDQLSGDGLVVPFPSVQRRRWWQEPGAEASRRLYPIW